MKQASIHNPKIYLFASHLRARKSYITEYLRLVVISVLDVDKFEDYVCKPKSVSHFVHEKIRSCQLYNKKWKHLIG